MLTEYFPEDNYQKNQTKRCPLFQGAETFGLSG